MELDRSVCGNATASLSSRGTIRRALVPLANANRALQSASYARYVLYSAAHRRPDGTGEGGLRVILMNAVIKMTIMAKG